MENALSFRKTDVLYSAILGCLIGALVPFIMTNLSARLPLQNFLFIIFAIMAPAGLYIFYLLSAKIPSLYQIGKFGIVGSSNFFVDLGIFNLLIYLSDGESASLLFSVLGLTITIWTLFKAFSFLAANTNSYFWNRFWTFQHKEAVNVKTEYAQFLVVSLIGFLVNITAFSLVFFFRPADVSEALWGTIGVVCGTIAGLAVNFVGYKFFVFKK